MAFSACHAALARGAHSAILPEGEMHTGTTLMPLKTGAAQAALERQDPEGMLTAFMLGASCLAKWPDYLDMTPEGHPHFTLEAK